MIIQRAEIQIGSDAVEGFILPDGSYRMSLSQAAEVVGKPVTGTFNFLRSKALKRLLGEGRGTFNFLGDEAIAAISSGDYTILAESARVAADFIPKKRLLTWGLRSKKHSAKGSEASLI